MATCLATASLSVVKTEAAEMRQPRDDAAPSDVGVTNRCQLRTGTVATVTEIMDGETLRLDNGRRVRLIGALAPRASDAPSTKDRRQPLPIWPAETATRQFLQDYVLGRRIRLAFGHNREDRHHHLLAHVFVLDGSSARWLQGELLLAGLARAYGLPGSFTCHAELEAHERAARQANRGLWKNRAYMTRQAADARWLMSRRNRYERVTGRIAKVAVTKSATYLNFGSDWRSDFTVRVGRDVLKRHPEFAGTLASLQSRTVTARGWIERRNGPMIDLWHPSQLDVAPSQSDTFASKDAAPTAPTATPLSKPNGRRHQSPPWAKENPTAPRRSQPGDLDL